MYQHVVTFSYLKYFADAYTRYYNFPSAILQVLGNPGNVELTHLKTGITN